MILINFNIPADRINEIQSVPCNRYRFRIEGFIFSAFQKRKEGQWNGDWIGSATLKSFDLAMIVLQNLMKRGYVVKIWEI